MVNHDFCLSRIDYGQGNEHHGGDGQPVRYSVCEIAKGLPENQEQNKEDYQRCRIDIHTCFSCEVSRGKLANRPTPLGADREVCEAFNLTAALSPKRY